MATRHKYGLIGFLSLLALNGGAQAESGLANVKGDADRGAYLAILGDCDACHTKPKTGRFMAGGYPLKAPMGVIYSSNITPSKTAGIGNYTQEQFGRALREGIRADGANLYPAMPYTHFKELDDQDIADLYAYFMTKVPPVDEMPQKTDLSFPYKRPAMIFWNMLFLDQKRFTPDPNHDAEWNRGKFLVDGPAHCGACHTPRGFMMQSLNSTKALQGAMLGGWYAPNITNDPKLGLGDWTIEDVTTYLHTGRVQGRAQAAGGMAEAVVHSFQHTKPEDLRAIAVYIKSLPGAGDTNAEAVGGFPKNPPASPVFQGATLSTNSQSVDGEKLYVAVCASCHTPAGGGGKAGVYPALTHNTALTVGDGANLIMTILKGVDRKTNDNYSFMPGFAPHGESQVQSLSAAQIAAVANYVETQFGDPRLATFNADKVDQLANGGPKPLLVKLGNLAGPALIVCVIAALALIALWWSRRRTV